MEAVIEHAQSTNRNERLDQAAICLSTACLAHCLLVPALLVAAPWISMGVLGEKWFHLALVAAVAPLSLLAFRSGLASGDHRRILVPGIVGLVMIALAAVLEFFHLMNHEVAAGLTSIGGILLIVAHWRNLRRSGCQAGNDEPAIRH